MFPFKPILLAIVSILAFSSCKSIPEKVKENKAKFIQVGREVTTPLDISNLSGLLEQAKQNNTEAKLKYLDVDKLEIIYGKPVEGPFLIDSVVLFYSSSYVIFYDFANTARPAGYIEQNIGLKGFEIVDDRLYMGKN